MKYNPALDGVRALSVIAVVAFHTLYRPLTGAMIGVDVFFVLSGFLITTILRGEMQGSGALDLKRFYVRRASRLMPPLVLCMAATYVGYVLLVPETRIGLDVVLSLLYVSDYGISFWGVPEHIRHTWSLSVEEHFYLIWPAFLITTRKLSDRALLQVLLVMFAVATIWRVADCLIWDDWVRTYYRFDTRLSGMILGAVLAVGQWKVSEHAAAKMGGIALYLLALMVVALRWKAMPSLMIGTLAAELAAAALIIALTSGHETSVSKMLSRPWLVYLGVLSYSIYLWHYGFAYVLRDAINPVWAFVISLGASVVISAISHKYVEKPIKAWVNRNHAHAAKRVTEPAYAN